MKIIIAKNIGFCYGVKRAIKKAYELKKIYKNEKIYTLGPLIHNKGEIELLKKNNIINISEKSLKNISSKSPVLIRSHGIGKSIIEFYIKKNNIINTTCSMVINAQKIGNKYANKGYKVIVVGDKKHPEVQGILNWSGNDSIAISSIEEAKSISLKKPILLIAQTTEREELFNLIKKFFIKKTKNFIFKNTICKSTTDRQLEIKNLAKKVEILFIIGSKLSSNTNKLYEIAKKINENSYLIEKEKELNFLLYENKKTIGIASGASTPKFLINKIINKIKNTIKE